jgi:hypothetical protein
MPLLRLVRVYLFVSPSACVIPETTQNGRPHKSMPVEFNLHLYWPNTSSTLNESRAELFWFLISGAGAL